MISRPQLLVLDEATSALEWESQNAILSTLEKLRGIVTVLVIAHRPQMVAAADFVIALEAGRLVEQGSPDELAGADGIVGRMLSSDIPSAPAVLPGVHATNLI